MRANFPSPILEFTLRQEGGLSNDAGDPGGLTKWGITHAVYAAWRTEMRLPPQSVKHMTAEERDKIYTKQYWVAIHGDACIAGVDCVLFDAAVNSGVKQALRWAQAAGDPVAIGAVNFIHRFTNARLSFLHLARGGVLWRRFGVGWGRRVGACEALALRLAAAPSSSSQLIANAAQDASHRAKVCVGRAKVAGSIAASALASHAITSGNASHGVIAIGGFGLGAAALLWLGAQSQKGRADALASEIS